MMQPQRSPLALRLVVLLLAVAPWPIGLRLPWLQLSVVAATIALTTSWLVLAAWTGRPLRWPSAATPAALFLAWTGTTTVAGLSAYTTASILDWAQLYAYLLLLLTVAQLRDGRSARALQNTVIFTGLAVALFAIVQHATWNGLLYWAYDPPYPGARFGPFDNRNYFAGYMAVVLPIALSRVLFGSASKTRSAALAASILGAAAVLASLSRAGTLALVCSSVVLLVAHRRSARSVPLVHALAALGAIVAMLAVLPRAAQAWRRVGTILTVADDISLLDRVGYWAATTDLISLKPVAGWGLGTFAWVVPSHWTAAVPPPPLRAHNELLAIGAESGLVGAILALWFLLALLHAAARRTVVGAGTDAEGQGLYVGALAAWVGIVVFSMTDYPSEAPAIGYTLAALAGLISARPPRAAHPEVDTAPSPDRAAPPAPAPAKRPTW